MLFHSSSDTDDNARCTGGQCGVCKLVCVCMCECVCVSVCVYVCVYVCVCTHVCMWVGGVVDVP